MHSEDKPKTITYKIDKTGISLEDRKILFSEIRSYTHDTIGNTTIVNLDLEFAFSIPVILVIKSHDKKALEILDQYIPYRKSFSLMRWITNRLYY